MAKLSVSLVQYNISWMDTVSNYSKIETLLERSSRSDLMVLPEMFNTGFCIKEPQMAETMDGRSIEFMLRMANKFNTQVAASLMIEEEGKVYNRFVAVNAGGPIAQYDKAHLFNLSGEDVHFTPGNGSIDFEISGFRIRPVICYDLRFPYICFNDTDYDLLLVVANWPYVRIQHWESLLQARAIENQAYVVAVNRVGVDPFGTEYPGHSTVFDAMGNCMLKFTGETNKSVALDKELLLEQRTRLPFIKDRKR